MKIEQINWEQGRIREIRFATESDNTEIILVAELYSDLKADYRKRVDIKFKNLVSIEMNFDINQLQRTSYNGNIISGLASPELVDIELSDGRLKVVASDIQVVRY